MKKFIQHLFFFFLLVVVFIFAIDSIPLPDKYIVFKTAGTDYEKIGWNLELLNEQPGRISGSIIFLGPSVVQSDICDSMLVSKGFKVINMGTNGPGNEVELYFLKRVLKQAPNRVYLHLFKNRHKDLHSMAPLLYTPFELMEAGQSVTLAFIEFLFKRTFFVLDYLIRNISLDENIDYSNLEYGVRYEENMPAAEFQKLDKKQMEDYFDVFNFSKNNFKKRSEERISGFWFKIVRLRRFILDSFYNVDFFYNRQSQKRFMMKEIELEKANPSVIQRIYFPALADARINEDFSTAFYSDEGFKEVVSLKNFGFLDHFENWADLNHLSRKGAILFSKELVVQGIVKP